MKKLNHLRWLPSSIPVLLLLLSFPAISRAEGGQATLDFLKKLNAAYCSLPGAHAKDVNFICAANLDYSKITLLVPDKRNFDFELEVRKGIPKITLRNPRDSQSVEFVKSQGLDIIVAGAINCWLHAPPRYSLKMNYSISKVNDGYCVEVRGTTSASPDQFCYENSGSMTRVRMAGDSSWSTTSFKRRSCGFELESIQFGSSNLRYSFTDSGSYRVPETVGSSSSGAVSSEKAQIHFSNFVFQKAK